MKKTLKFLLMILIPAAIVCALTLDVRAAQKSRSVYRIALASSAGGPVRAALPAGSPASLLVRSSVTLDATEQARLAWHFRNANLLAERFANRKGLGLSRHASPNRLEIFTSPGELAEGTMLPRSEYGCEVVARIDLQMGIVFLGRSTPEDLYVELGKWYLYPAGYRWGQDRDRDMAMLRTAEQFASFCMEKNNWTETDGSMKSLW